MRQRRSNGDDVDLKDFQNRSEGDRHQFRFIVSADEGTDIEDHKSFTRDLMTKMAQDLQTRLDWVAVDNFDTDHPHTHLVLRGVDDSGKDLIIAKSYMSYGMRNMASNLLTQELGPRTEMEILQQVRRQVGQDRMGDLDIHIIMDNYATHKTKEVKAWLSRRPYWHVHFTPTSASWINQIERWFAELTRKQLKRGVHVCVKDLKTDIMRLVKCHKKTRNLTSGQNQQTKSSPQSNVSATEPNLCDEL